MYVKMDASEQLLLSEGACHQLDIVTYPEVQQWRKWQTRWYQHQEETQVPPVRVKLVKSIWLPPSHSAVVDTKLSANVSTDRPLLLEDCTYRYRISGLLRTIKTGLAQLVISNMSGWTELKARIWELLHVCQS